MPCAGRGSNSELAAKAALGPRRIIIPRLSIYGITIYQYNPHRKIHRMCNYFDSMENVMIFSITDSINYVFEFRLENVYADFDFMEKHEM